MMKQSFKNMIHYTTMEHNCELVSSRGLLKSCTFHHPNPQSSVDNVHEYLENDWNQKENMSIYVNSTSLSTFVDVYLPKINKKFYLVSGDADLAVPKEVLNNNQFTTLMDNPFLICWFAQNLFAKSSEKLKHLPIGLDYHTIYQEPTHWWRMESDGEGYLPCEQEILLKKIKLKSSAFFLRCPTIYSNVHFRPDRYGQREKAVNTIPENLLKKATTHLSRSQTWERTIEHAFVLSPFGNGYDCHRSWESLCLGSIPIMMVPEFDELFEDLPVINVKSWEEITEEFLQQKITEFTEKEFNLDKLTLDYWVKKFTAS